MYYQENYRKAHQYLIQRQKQIDFQPNKLNQPQIITIRKILEVIRSKDRSNSYLKYKKTTGQEKKEETHSPQRLITSNQEPKNHNRSIVSKLLRLNKITRNKTQVTPIQYNFIDRIIEPTKKKIEIQSERNSPLRIRKNIPCIDYQMSTQVLVSDNQKQVNNNMTDRQFFIQKPRLIENINQQQAQSKSIQNFLSHHQSIRTEQASPSLRRLNKTSYQCEQTKNNTNQIKNENIDKQIQLIRKVSGWTIQSQDSIQTPF
ncbi:unnamed protein product [Paramecium pentaurelia]|uniref:Uncharacterized protein n=1 Tax=Paramecium pentaurelia TaxID=43138 RepID=A0A8S1SVI2_9CILI|nr:unnamed protein product [Paramecium pentaurelia]